MAKKFSISEGMLNGISKNTEKVNTLEAKENFKIEYIDIDKIVRNEKNFYEISDIDTLAEDILLNGLNHNLVVSRVEDGLYKLISGERRYTALKKLVKSGESKFRVIPCKISNLNDVDSEIVLIQANAQSRELSEAEKLKQVQRLTELYTIKKKNGEKVGKIREAISKDTGLSTTQVGRYSVINKSLIPELKQLLNEGDLSIANASEFATLSEENQKIILSIINNKVNISKSEANELKKQFKEIEIEKNNLIKKEIQYKTQIEELNKKNENESEIIENRIEAIKLELSKKYNADHEQLKKENELKEKELENLAKEKALLEEQKKQILEEQEKNKNIDEIINNKAKEIASNFEKDKNNIKKENKKLKKELIEMKSESYKLTLNHELKIRLKSVRKEISMVAGLLANNTIMDEETLKEVNNLKSELKFLNDQTELYTNQTKI